MDGWTLIFLFLLAVFVVLCLGELRGWLEEGNDRIEQSSCKLSVRGR